MGGSVAGDEQDAVVACASDAPPGDGSRMKRKPRHLGGAGIALLLSVRERCARFGGGGADARDKIIEGATRDHVPARGAFERDVLFDDEPLVASANLLDGAEVAENERLGQAPIAAREPRGEFRDIATLDE